MEQKSLRAIFSKIPQIDETANQLQFAGTRIHWKGLVGSSKSLCASALANQIPGHQLFILNDKEEAAYFLNDLEGIFPEDKRIYFILRLIVCLINSKKQIMQMWFLEQRFLKK